MKFFTKIIVLLCLLLGNCVSAEPFKVVVLPVDLFSVCDNYYCFPEVSEIIAEDVINNFNKCGKIVSPNIYDIRKKFEGDSKLKASAVNTLTRFKNKNSIDFTSAKVIADAFGAKSLLLINSLVTQPNSRRSVWEVMEVSSVFEAYSSYTMETYAVLTDNVNDVVMWSGKYKRRLADNESRFWALTSAQALSQLEKLKFYSRDIISKNISENVVLRFYPKVTEPILPQSIEKTETTDFRPNPLQGTNFKPQENKEYEEIDSEMIFDF